MFITLLSSTQCRTKVVYVGLEGGGSSRTINMISLVSVYSLVYPIDLIYDLKGTTRGVWVYEGVGY